MAMTYLSTRGENDGATYASIVLKGLAADGGLFMPATYPQVTVEDLARFKELTYAELAYEILSRFADDIPAADLKKLTASVYRTDVYCNVREGEDAARITPVKKLAENLWLLELSDGPTLAFKDMAMQYLGALFEYLLAKTGQELNILGATSGDTGSAAEYAMRGRKGIRVFMLSPAGRMSAFQRAQMYTLADKNIFNIAVKGTFDDAQDIVKAVSNDHAYKAAHSIGTVNSINWARVAAQVVDVLDEFFKTGTYRVRDSAHTYVTSSPSMDISKASNFERYIFDIVVRNPARVKELWRDVAEKGGFTLTAEEFARVKASGFVSGKSTHADRLVTIAGLWKSDKVLIDPHTADGLKAAREHQRAGIPMMTLETALPAKFAATIKEAVGFEPEIPASYRGLFDKPQHSVEVPADTETVKRYITEHANLNFA